MRVPVRRPKDPITVVLQLDAMTYGGDAIGRAGGKAVFVPGGIAGEQVRAAIVEDRGHFARARLLEVIEASPDRVQPRCPHFGFEETASPDRTRQALVCDPGTACGGCHWQHVDYAAQVRFKTEIVREQFRRIGRIADAPVREAIPSPEAWGYRNHAQFSVAPGGRLGFQAAHSNRVVPIDECHVIQPPIADWLRANRETKASAGRWEVRSFGGEGGSAEAWPQNAPASNLQPLPSNFQIKGATFRVSAGSFFQVNTSLIETLIDQVLNRLDLRGGETVVDAYCGVGLFARFIAPRAGRVIGIESSAGAIADARENLQQFGNVELREGLAENELLGVVDSIDAMIVDPPRAGCGPKVIRALIETQVNRLVYVSCDPSTLARDARQVLGGGYELIDVQPLDMFPQTYHVETVALFIRPNREA
jgi:23S rRNA (uracil1939-C5)-methyltransferase